MTREELLKKIAEKKSAPDPGFEILDRTIAEERREIAKERQNLRMSRKGFMTLYQDMKAIAE